MDDPRGQDAGRFDTTQWSAVFRAQSAQSTAGRQALADLVQRYYPALRVHLLRKRWLDEHRVNDLLQGFVADKLLEKRLVDRADPSKGKFRALLVRALENYVIDQLRGDPPPAAEFKADPLDGTETNAFDVAWARSLLTDTLDRMRQECSGKQRAPIWEVFDCRLLQPTRQGVEPTPYDELVRRFGFESPDQASNALVTAKRTFNRIFAQVAAGYLADDEQPEDLVAELLTTLHRSGPLEWQGSDGTAPAAEVPEAHRELDDTSPRLLAAMIDSPPDADSLWTSADLGDYLRHLLAQPI
ncbi:MAG: sigma-70 family RNA polymerase sigma factor, partial [Planctomycetaceae bacterium]|nr:sigma-70 family RNA polymerase sigma factor [Planctomycetaceae bacterium]